MHWFRHMGHHAQQLSLCGPDIWVTMLSSWVLVDRSSVYVSAHTYRVFSLWVMLGGSRKLLFMRKECYSQERRYCLSKHWLYSVIAHDKSSTWGVRKYVGVSTEGRETQLFLSHEGLTLVFGVWWHYARHVFSLVTAMCVHQTEQILCDSKYSVTIYKLV